MKGLSKKDVNIWPTIAVFDCETRDWTDVYIVAHVDEFGNEKAFKSIRGYLNWLFGRDRRGRNNFNSDIVWAHNAGKFDTRFVIADVCENEGSWKTFESSGTLVITNVYDRESKRTIKFCDSLRLLPSKAEEIGKMVGLPKLGDEVDIENMGKDPAMLKTEIEYCIRDCYVIMKGLQYLRDITTKHNCDFAFTLASMSSRWVRRSFCLDFVRFCDPKNLRKENDDFIQADEISMSAYFGGRTELIKRGKFDYPLYYYDIRSSYPASMRNDLPAYFKGYYPPPKKLTEKTLKRYLSYAGVTEAIVEIEPGTQYLPVLPVVIRDRFSNKLVFPEGKFRGVWTNIELLASMERGARIMPIVQTRFTSRPFLRQCVETFYTLRQDAINRKDKAAAYIYKIFLNSLYGKLAETVKREHTLFGPYEYAEAKLQYGVEAIQPHPGKFPGVYQVKTESRGPFRHVAAGAYITAYSRLLLLKYLEWTMELGGQIYYMDTDSLVTDIKLPETPDELGNLKLEAVFTQAEFWAPKVYRGVLESGEAVYHVKGIPVMYLEGRNVTDEEKYHRWLAYKQKVYPEDIDKSVWEAHNWDEDFLTSKWGITGFKTDLNKCRIFPLKVKMNREMKNEDTKRIHEDGNSKPLVVELIA